MDNMLDENDLNKAKEIFEKYQDFFKECHIESLNDIKIQKLPDYLADRYPEKYGVQNFGDYQNYHTDKNLNEVFVFVGKEEAYFFGTDDAVIKGHIANENLKEGKENGKITLSEELRRKNSQVIFANNPEKAKKFEENFFHGDGKDLEVLEQILEKQGNFQNRIKEQAKKIDPNMPEIEFDSENQVAQRGQTRSDGEKGEDGEEIGQEDRQENARDSLVSRQMLRQARLLGYTKIKSVVQAKGGEAANKIDMPGINRNAGNVTILRLNDTGKETDKYLVFQGDRLVVPGNKDDEMDKLLRRDTQYYRDGTLIKPLEIEDEEQFLEYDKDGISIDMKLQEDKDLSVSDLEEYKRRFEENVEKLLEKFSEIESKRISDAEKDKEYLEANEMFNSQNRNDAKDCNINIGDMEDINIATDVRTQEQVDKEQGGKRAPGGRARGEIPEFPGEY